MLIYTQFLAVHQNNHLSVHTSYNGSKTFCSRQAYLSYDSLDSSVWTDGGGVSHISSLMSPSFPVSLAFPYCRDRNNDYQVLYSSN